MLRTGRASPAGQCLEGDCLLCMKRRFGRGEGWVPLQGSCARSRDSACDVGEKQPVSGGLVGRMLMSRRGQGSEGTSEGCQQCRALPVIQRDRKPKGSSHQSEVPDCLGQMYLSVPLPGDLGRGEGAAEAAGLLLSWCGVLP